MRYVYLDCEFIREDLTPTGLISIGIKSGDRRYYAVNGSMDSRRAWASEWMRGNVWPHIPNVGRYVLDRSHPDVRDYGLIKEQVSDFFEEMCPRGNGTSDVKLAAWCGGQDLVRLHGFWNHDWAAMPLGIPRYLHDIQEDIVDSGISEDDLPAQDPSTVHHALFDAEYDEVIHRFIEENRAV